MHANSAGLVTVFRQGLANVDIPQIDDLDDVTNRGTGSTWRGIDYRTCGNILGQGPMCVCFW